MTATSHRTREECAEFLAAFDPGPAEQGRLELIVARPGNGERAVLDVGELDTASGLVGDNWRVRGSRHTPDGSANPEAQVTVMSYRVAAFVAVEAARIPLAGDQFYVDLDLSVANLPAGSRLLFGGPSEPGAVLEVSATPHTGCAKFVDRFGAEAMRLLGADRRSRRLRGLNARVVQPGTVRRGDLVTVQRP